MDDDIKKLLVELKLEDLAKELGCDNKSEQKPQEMDYSHVEPTPQAEQIANEEIPKEQIAKNSFFSKKRLFITTCAACVIAASIVVLQKEPQMSVAADVLIAENESPLTSLKERITSQDPDLGLSVGALMTSLQARKRDLEAITKELTALLEKNAGVFQDFFATQANTVLSRYHAVDARYSFEIGHQISLINSAIQKKQNPQLERNFADMQKQLNCQTYNSYQQQIAKELVRAEFTWEDALDELEEAESLQDLQAAVSYASKMMEDLKKNGFMQAFLNLTELQKELPTAAENCLNWILFEQEEKATDSFDTESREDLQAILAEIGASDEAKSRYMAQFEVLAKQAEEQAASKRNFHQLLRKSFSGQH